MGQLKEKDLLLSGEANGKNIFWVDMWVSGGEGVNGVYKSKRVTQSMLQQIFGISNSEDYTIDLADDQFITIYADYDQMKIDSITNVFGVPTVDIKVNGFTYTLGDLIALGSKIDILVNTPSVIRLKVTK